MKLLPILLVLAIACAEADDVTGTTEPPPTTTSEETVPTTEPDFNGELSLTVERSRADLAAHLAVDESSINVASAEPVTWSDGSLGCPEPGMMYTQALVEGSRVVLERDSRFYDYHAGTDDQPFLCESDAEDGGYDSIPPLEGTVSE